MATLKKKAIIVRILMAILEAVVDPGGDPRVPRIPPFSLAIVASCL